MDQNKNVKSLTPAQFAFMKWINETHPNLMKAAEEHHKSLGGFLDTMTSTFNTIMTKAPDLLSQYVTGKAQIDTLKLNLERAKVGQMPLTDAGGIYTGAPNMLVQQTLIPGVPNWILGGAVAAIAVYLLMRK